LPFCTHTVIWRETRSFTVAPAFDSTQLIIVGIKPCPSFPRTTLSAVFHIG
jgi:hypothetical protein